MTDCEICAIDARLDELPIRERLWFDEHWRLSHAWSALEGWLVLCSRRHTQSLEELGPEANRRLGELLPEVSTALKEVTGCDRIYVMLFAENPGFQHIHFHLVPRMPWFTASDAGPRVFHFLKRPEDEYVPADRRDQLSRLVAESLARRL